MIKKMMLGLATAMTGMQVMAGDIALPKPQLTGEVSLMQALQQRHSDRSFSEKALDNQTLSNLLWVAYGVNRPDGRRTIPTALNEKDLNIYVVKADGIFLYEADNNLLKQVSDKNALNLFQAQDYMRAVPVVFVYTGNSADYSVMHAGAAYQNVGLYTATNGLGSIVRGYFDKQEVAKALGLSATQRVIISQAIGWAAN